MDPAEKAQLQGLHTVLHEVLSNGTPHARKQQIEASLAEFKRQPGAWMTACSFMQNTADPNVLWYCASVLEYTVTTMWSTIVDSQKVQFREFILQYYSNCGNGTPLFVSNKLAKVYADVGKRDWPQTFPNFLDGIFALIQENPKQSKGLALLKITMEECVNSRTVLARRATEFRKCLLMQIPIVLACLNQLLEQIFVTAVSEAEMRASQTGLRAGSTPASPGIFDGRVLPQGSDVTTDKFIQLGDAVEEKATKALECVLQLFSWIDLSTMVTPALMDTLYNYAQLTDPTNASLGTLAIGCFNEMLANHCAPANFAEYLHKLSTHLLLLLKKMTDPTIDGSNVIATMDEDFNSKFTEFLELFISSHLNRIECDQGFPMVDFLTHIFKYTFLQPSSDGFVTCLGACNKFLDVLSMKMESSGPQSIASYQPSLVMLVSELITKLRFATNGAELSQFDSTSRDDVDCPTEWEEHVGTCMETVGLVAQLFPAQVVKVVLPKYLDEMQKYKHVHEFLPQDSSKNRESFPNAETQEAVYTVARDLGTMIQVVGRLSGYFANSLHTDRFAESLGLVQSLVDLLQYSNIHALYNVNVPFADVHIQLLFTLKLFGNWFSCCCRAARESPADLTKFSELVLSVMNCSWSVMSGPSCNDPVLRQVLLAAAANTFEGIAKTVRPQGLLMSSELEHILNNAANFKSFPQKVGIVMSCACVHCTLAPWYDLRDTEQNWNVREAKFAVLFNGLFQKIPEMAQNPSKEAEPICTVLAAVLRSLQDLSKTPKEVFMKGLQPLLPVLLQMFQAYTGHAAALGAILDILLAMFESLPSLLPVEFIKQAMGQFLQFFSRDQFQSLASGGNENQNQILVTFFAILKFIVQSRSSVFKPFIGEICSVCVDASQVLTGPAVAIDVKLSFFEVLKFIFLDNWKYFYPNKVSPVKIQRSDATECPIMHEDQFGAFLTAFGTSFSQEEITPFKANLQTIVDIDAQKRLFQMPFFRDRYYVSFVEVFLLVICAKSHSLLEDEIYQALFALASVDKALYIQHGVAAFLAKVASLSDPQRAELINQLTQPSDFHSFRKELQGVCDDIVYIQQQNTPQ